MTDTSIRISSDVRDRLRAEKQGGESYDDVLDRLLGEKQPLPQERVEELISLIESDDADTGDVLLKALEGDVPE